MVDLSDELKEKIRFMLGYESQSPIACRQRLEEAMKNVLSNYAETKIKEIVARCEEALNRIHEGTEEIEERTTIAGYYEQTIDYSKAETLQVRRRKFEIECNLLAQSLAVENLRLVEEPKQLTASGIISLPGPQGNQGEQGIEGMRGPRGLQGERGVPANQGAPGPPGDSIEGPRGLRGWRGDRGLPGLPGPKGNQGDSIEGMRGLRGWQGDRGLQGLPGPQGNPGDSVEGTRGLRGWRGDRGLPGKDWTQYRQTITFSNPINAETTLRISVGIAPTFLLFKLQCSHAAWIRIYESEAAQLADLSRLQTEEPVEGIGLQAQLKTVPSYLTINLSPVAICQNLSGVGTWISITNNELANQTIQITLTYIAIESI